MTLKMQNIVSFGTFYESIRSQKMPMKIAYKLAQLAKAIDTELEFYRTKMQEIIREFGELDEFGSPVPTEDGKGVKLRPGMEMGCYNAMTELQNIEVTLPDIVFQVEDFDSIELTVEDMAIIMPFIENQTE